MNTAWQTETGSLECRWSGLMERTQYTPDWLREASAGPHETVLTPVPDFAAHSPFGSGEWFVPWNSRLRLPSRS